MALTPPPALWKTRLSFIPVLGFGTGKVSAVTAPSREGGVVLTEMRRDIKGKRRTKMLLFSAQIFLLGPNPRFWGFKAITVGC